MEDEAAEDDAGGDDEEQDEGVHRRSLDEGVGEGGAEEQPGGEPQAAGHRSLLTVSTGRPRLSTAACRADVASPPS